MSRLATLWKKLYAPASRGHRASRRMPSCTPRLEALEDRQLLATFLVTNTLDSGAGSLRQAILNANATAGTSTINFSIGTGGAQTINVRSPLPALTNPVVINGAAQPGYAGQPLVELNGALAGSGAPGLDLRGGSSTVQGLAINRFGGAGILLDSASNTVANDYIGTDLTGTVALPNSSGVYVNGTANNVIGGTTAAARDVISGNTSSGVYLYGAGATGNTVEGDFIGTDASGSGALGNGTGVELIYAPYNNIGGYAAGNVISANTLDGVFIEGSTAWGNVVQSNMIGTDVSGSSPLGNYIGVFVYEAPNTSIGSEWGYGNTISDNRDDGVAILGSDARFNHVQNNTIMNNSGNGVTITDWASDNTVGGFFYWWSEGNTIALNSGYGVSVESGIENTIRANSVYGNALGGINLYPGANNDQPAPILLGADSVFQLVAFQFYAPPGTYTLDFYSNDLGTGQGRTYLGSMTVTVGSTGMTEDAFRTPTIPLSSGESITATATDSSGNTSVFSQSVDVTLPL
jgi:hypothetical protein